jgi:uncharacterized protein
LARPGVRGTFSQPGPSRPAAAVRLARTLGRRNNRFGASHAAEHLTAHPAHFVPIIQVKVKPNARTSALEKLGDGTYLVSLKAQPIDGKANAELISVLAKHFGTTKSAVTIKTGSSARVKLVAIATD